MINRKSLSKRPWRWLARAIIFHRSRINVGPIGYMIIIQRHEGASV